MVALSERVAARILWQRCRFDVATTEGLFEALNTSAIVQAAMQRGTVGSYRNRIGRPRLRRSRRKARFPPPPLSNSLNDNELPEGPTALVASGQRLPGIAGQSVAADDVTSTAPSFGLDGPPTSAIARITKVWPSLPPHIREAIMTLVDVAMQRG